MDKKSHIMKNPWNILGVSHEASESEVKEAYRSLAKKYHPDINPAPDAHERFIEIQQAYDLLITISQKTENPHDDFSGRLHAETERILRELRERTKKEEEERLKGEKKKKEQEERESRRIKEEVKAEFDRAGRSSQNPFNPETIYKTILKENGLNYNKWDEYSLTERHIAHKLVKGINNEIEIQRETIHENESMRIMYG